MEQLHFQLSFENSMTSTLSMIFRIFLRLYPGMLKMSFIAQDFDKLDIITVPEERTQADIRNHFLRYNRAVRCQVKIITMGMFSPYYDLAKQLFRVLKSFSIVFTLRYYISELRLKQSTGLFYSNT